MWTLMIFAPRSGSFGRRITDMVKEFKTAEVVHQCSQHTGIEYLTAEEFKRRTRTMSYDHIWCSPCQAKERILSIRLLP